MIRLLAILGGLSGAMDLGTGAPLDESLLRCVLAARLAGAVGCADQEVRTALHVSLLEHLGCTAASHEATRVFGDDISVVRHSFAADPTRSSDLLRAFVPGVAAASGRGRVRTLVAALRAAGDPGPPRATCEVASDAARRLGLGEDVERALAHVTAAWNGKGYPTVGGEGIPLATRIAHVAGTAVLVALGADAAAAHAELRRRAGTQLDPRLVEACTPELIDGVLGATPDPLDVVLDLEPDPVRLVGDGQLHEVARTFGDLVDLKSPRLHGHSAAVAGLAADAAARLRPADPGRLRLAGHLHDVGRIGVPTRIWEKTGPLTRTERDQARLHPYYTERILARTPELADVAAIAGGHHERCDGSGYHRGLRAPDLTVESRILAAADAYRLLVEEPGASGIRPDSAHPPWRMPYRRDLRLGSEHRRCRATGRRASR
ncbi:HD-GYP domain-containing protein [Georgenia sp. SUBG003]|uniref:HD-GYP domain-containing protein n=1 Tax=Georgenia sp. SUBG003 TaxID=1497974 RepID=UPI003AB83967